jgi:hypothetical protein
MATLKADAVYHSQLYDYEFPCWGRCNERELELVGWTKARDLAEVAGRERQGFDFAPWVLKTNTIPRAEFKREVDRYLTGKVIKSRDIHLFQGVQDDPHPNASPPVSLSLHRNESDWFKVNT